MQAKRLDELIDETSLLPHVVGETVAREDVEVLAPSKFGQYVTWRTLILYNTNPRWRERIRRIDGREYLYMFARHWLPAWKARQIKVR